MTVETPIEMLLFLNSCEIGSPENCLRRQPALHRSVKEIFFHAHWRLTPFTNWVARNWIRPPPAVVDGGGDGGIDAIFHSATANTLWIAQSKFISTGRGEPELGDVTKFKTGLENLMQGNFDAFRSNDFLESYTSANRIGLRPRRPCRYAPFLFIPASILFPRTANDYSKT